MPAANPRVAERGPDGSLRYATLARALLIAFAFQGSRGLFEPDEGRYANIALQMLETGNYLDPRLNSETLHFAEPPLTYWLIAGSIAAQLAREVDVAKIDELVFVEAPPYYELHFYLRPQVDAAQLPSLEHHTRAALRAPDVCSRQRSGSRQVFIVPPALRTDFDVALRDCRGLQAEQHGHAGRHEIYTLGAASGVRVAGGLQR